jgi:gluconokinase
MMAPQMIVLMGVAGSGKTTVGQALAKKLGVPFFDGDNFHTPANVDKMAAGMPLNDGDRSGWLAGLADLIRASLTRGESGVLACSALKKKYRMLLRAAAPDGGQVRFVFLQGSYELILARMERRRDHYMQPGMLQSQFDALEEPSDAITVDIAAPLEDQVIQIVEQLGTKEERNDRKP